MGGLWSGFCVAFSLYSAIPVPQVNWEKRTMRWALCFLPLVGAVIGGLEYGWYRLCAVLGAAPLLYAVGGTLVPILVSGGIHLDGFTDTCDALCSYGSQEKRLEIMKDPHIGAFGVLWLIALLLGETALFAQLYETPTFLPAGLTAFVLARAVGGRAIVALECAKNTGLAHLFAENTERACTRRVLTAELVLCGIGLIVWQRGFGVVLAVLTVLWAVLHARFCRKTFGGITGDLAGFGITLTEILGLAAAAFGGLFV